MAFALENWWSGPKDDPRYVQWVIQITTGESYNDGIAFYPMHRCTDDDFSRFHQFEDSSARKAEGLLASGSLWCVDPSHLVSLKGSWRTGEKFGAIEPSLFTCGSEIKLFDGTK